MPRRFTVRALWGAFLSAAALWLSVPSASRAQEPTPEGAAPAAPADEDLKTVESRLAERYDRLELSVARLAELSNATQPRRAALLRQLVAQSRERDLSGQFDQVVEALEQGSLSSAIDGQAALEAELQKLLDLLLQEDRDRQIESERKRVARYLQDVNRLIRMQRGVTARTDGNDEQKQLIKDQGRVGDQTMKLGEEIEQSEETAEQRAAREQSQKGGKALKEQPSQNQADPRATENGDRSEDGQPSSSGDKSTPSAAEPTDQPPASSESTPSKGDPSGPPSQSQSGDGQGNPSPESANQEAQSPAQRAAERLKQAQERMKEAEKQLEDANRQGAAADQAKAIEKLEQAKAELERILRQLREEELERMLVMLESRIRKMLEDQIAVYYETKQLDAASDKAATHEVQIACARLARKENLIVREADRALVLLREDGTSVAFPEAIEQARDDMRAVGTRLGDAKLDLITQGLEEDVIAALEESLAALQQQLKDLRSQQGQPQQGSGQPGEQPLVDQLAELRMIRSLQARVNRRTQQYGAMIEGEQAVADDLVAALRELSVRQQKIFQATHDLSTEER